MVWTLSHLLPIPCLYFPFLSYFPFPCLRDSSHIHSQGTFTINPRWMIFFLYIFCSLCFLNPFLPLLPNSSSLFDPSPFSWLCFIFTSSSWCGCIFCCVVFSLGVWCPLSEKENLSWNFDQRLCLGTLSMSASLLLLLSFSLPTSYISLSLWLYTSMNYLSISSSPSFSLNLDLPSLLYFLVSHISFLFLIPNRIIM